MERQTYTDFDEFADALRGVSGRFVPTARSSGEWWIERARVRDVGLQYLQIGSAMTFAGDGARDRLSIGIPIGSQAIRIDGQPLTRDAFALIVNDQPFTCSSRELTRWVGVAVPTRRLDGDSAALDRARAPVSGGTRNHTQQHLLDELRTLILRMCSEREVVSIVEPAATAAIEEEILQTVTRALEASSRASDRHIGRPQVSRTRVIACCLELIDATAGQPLFIDDLCGATQVSERTLRNVFQEYFGVGPMRLLKVRQLREIRSALLRGNPLSDTVTKIAARFGVWDFSLFARNYRALYGEAPSQTLRGPRGRNTPRRADDTLSPTWIGFAARRFASGRAMQVADTGN